MANGPLLHIQIRGADLGIIDGRVLAVIMPPPNAATWIATPAEDGAFRFTDQAGGLVLGARDIAPGTPVEVGPPEAMAVASWQLTHYSDEDEDDAATIKDPSAVTSGYYAIRDSLTGAYLHRNRIEDYSIMPKRVALQPGAVDPGPVVIRIVG